MKLNKNLASVVMASGLMSAGAMAADGTITFNGAVVANACSAVAGITSATIATPTLSPTITLPNITATALNAGGVGSYAGHTPFSIRLRGCESTADLTALSVIFDSPSRPPEDLNVAGNTIVTGATNVGIAILETYGPQINMNGGSSSSHNMPPLIDPRTPADMELRYVAAYKVLGTVTAGLISSTVNYTITYN